jgi:17 kDa outer membrane surface antigen
MRYSLKFRFSLLFFMLPLAGCGVTLSLPSFWKTQDPALSQVQKNPPIREEEEEDKITTGSIAPNIPREAFQPSYLSKEDWQHIKAALMAANLSPEAFPSKAYENEASGTYGTLTIIRRISQNCKEFLGSSVINTKEYWFEGIICKMKDENFELTKLDTLNKKQ